MPTTNQDDDFYEEDEPLEEIISAFENGDKGITAPTVGICLAGPSGNFGCVTIGEYGAQVGWFVTDAQAVANTSRPPLARTG
jgi:hypothetical protein